MAPGARVGKNATTLLAFTGGPVSFDIEGVAIVQDGRKHALRAPRNTTPCRCRRLASVPGETRDIVRETSIEEYRKDPSSGNEPERKHESLWPGHSYEGTVGGLAVDLGACTGCSACVVSLPGGEQRPGGGQGRESRQRDMYWLRIDRYYADRDGETDVVFQPMMCQHCGNAPCETVCPVLATVHSTEGLNQQVYNRCVGTALLRQQLPLQGPAASTGSSTSEEGRLSNLALNPDVTVRMRGVMEKCTFCVQRIQEAKFEAKRQGPGGQDGDITPACAQSCPAQAIVFGDLNDPKSRVSQVEEGRAALPGPGRAQRRALRGIHGQACRPGRGRRGPEHG